MIYLSRTIVFSLPDPAQTSGTGHEHDCTKLNKRGDMRHGLGSHLPPMASPLSRPHSPTSSNFSNSRSPYSSDSQVFHDNAAHPAMNYPGSSIAHEVLYSHDAEPSFYPGYMQWNNAPKPQQYMRQEWHHVQHDAYTHPMSQSGHRVDHLGVKSDALSYHSSGSSPPYTRNIFDLSHQQAPPIHTQQTYSNITYYAPSPEPSLRQGYIQPSELSPVDSHDYSHSPESPQSGCDPRYVSGVPSGYPGGRHSVDSTRSRDAVSEHGVYAQDGAASQDRDTALSDSYAEDSLDDGDDDEDDADDDDGEYVEGRSRRAVTARRTNRRTAVNRYTPYTEYAYDMGVSNGRPRRHSSDTTSSASSLSSIHPISAAAVPSPIPVPNLIKKSRGRHVPTVTQAESYGNLKARIHACEVDGCGKCFARGEHLKRHIRSIHTHDKRMSHPSSARFFVDFLSAHKCPFPGCGKDFSRHDNLGQHMRVHKGFRR